MLDPIIDALRRKRDLWPGMGPDRPARGGLGGTRARIAGLTEAAAASQGHVLGITSGW